MWPEQGRGGARCPHRAVGGCQSPSASDLVGPSRRAGDSAPYRRHVHGIATALGRCWEGIATVLFPWVSLRYPLYIPYLSLVHAWSSKRNFGSPTMSPPGPGLILTVLRLSRGEHDALVRMSYESLSGG